MIIKPDFFTHKAVKTIQTTRQGGISNKPFDSLNLNVFSEDKLVSDNLLKLTEEQTLPHTPVFMQQEHANKVVEYIKPPQGMGLLLLTPVLPQNQM